VCLGGEIAIGNDMLRGVDLRPDELLESIEGVLDELRSLREDIPIIVEGEADVKALRELGVGGLIIQMNVGQPLFNFCEEISKEYKEVVILTDWDRKGGHLCKVLKEDLKANDVKFNTDIRAKLVRFCKKETMDVEGLVHCVNRLKKLTKI
jgi:5S rRNA maturation endonuclease (ribonuclease M5)